METQIIELEKKYWQGMENHDYETVKKSYSFSLYRCRQKWRTKCR